MFRIPAILKNSSELASKEKRPAHSARARSLVDRALRVADMLASRQEQREVGQQGSAANDKRPEEQEQLKVGQQGSATDDERFIFDNDDMPFFDLLEYSA
jgi:hypothetical protein